MDIFKDYASYYNLLYQDKEYGAEANYIICLINKYCKDAKSILNLGCGTGRHDYIFATNGYDVTGVDMSPQMVEIAKQGAIENHFKGTVQFFEGDIRSLRLKNQYDVVLALFHVMSYQITNDDLHKAFETAQIHLKPGGVFIFDCWYGPGVLTDPPAVRLKKFENEELEVKRIARPISHPNENVIDVNYDIIIKEKKTSRYTEVSEKHRMRYLFKPELELFFKEANLDLLHHTEWMTENHPDLKSWNAVFIVKK